MCYVASVGPEQPKKNLFTGLLAQRKLQKARDSFLHYCQYVYPPYRASRHHRFLIQKLEAIERGEKPRTMVSMPPQHGKTVTVSQLFVCWYLGRDPRRRAIVATYGDDRAQDIGRAVLRTLRDDPRHREVFPDCQVDDNAASSARVDLVDGGAFLAVSRNGALTGRSADLLVIDDLLKDDKESRSAAILHENVNWYSRVALTRLAPDGSVILVGTRWGRGDLFDDRLTEHPEEVWDVTNLPALAEENDPLGRRVGEALWPERYSLEVLAQKRFEIGNAAFTCLYQGNPTAAEGVTFRREDWQFYTVMPEKFVRKVISLDAAVKTGAANDYSVLECWGKTETGYYLLALWRDKAEYQNLRNMEIEFYRQRKPDAVLIEDTSAGSSLAQDLRSTTSQPIEKITVTRDKESRAAAITPLVKCGSVYLPNDAPWLNDFLDEISQFPRGRHDDMVDCAVQALTYLRDSDSILTGWMCEGSSAFAAGAAATDAQKEMLARFASRGVPATDCPYFGPLGPAPTRADAEKQFETLAKAQKEGLAGEVRAQFNAARNLGPKVPAKPRPSCPRCGNTQLAMAGEYRSCVCGWNSKLKEGAA